MKLAVSNIAWGPEQDEAVYSLMKKYGYAGLEIAPTRIFPDSPYGKLREARVWAEGMKVRYGLAVPSMQSVWYGRREKLFGSGEDRKVLLDYTKKAIDFAAAVGCRNLVFGCPSNRAVPDGMPMEEVNRIAEGFFRDIGSYAAPEGNFRDSGECTTAEDTFRDIGSYAAAEETFRDNGGCTAPKGTFKNGGSAEPNGITIGLEANPQIYGTNYINTTREALELIRRVNSLGFRLNLDVGTMVQNGESVRELAGSVGLISHVHISEPGLKPIMARDLHRQLRELLEKEEYGGYISIEMGRQEDISVIENAMKYVKDVFGD